MTKLVYIVTEPITAFALLRGQLAHMRRAGFDVTLIAGPGDLLSATGARENVHTIAVPMVREIDPVRDLRSLGELVRVLRRLRPDIVHASTPKAGLLGMLAARSARVPVRVYLLRGLRLETERGMKKQLLWATERLAARLAHRVLCVSSSLLAAYRRAGLDPSQRATVLGAGSSNGVDLARFEPGAAPPPLMIDGVPAGAKIVGFVGRITADKGVPELLDAFDLVAQKCPDAWLVFLGAREDGDPIGPAHDRRLREGKNVRVLGFVPDPERYYVLMHVLAFPSFREGMPNAPIEAAAAGIPTVGFRVTGVVDAVEDGTTGRLLAPGDVVGFADALHAYLTQPDLRSRHGTAARERARRVFRQEAVWSTLENEFRALLAAAGR